MKRITAVPKIVFPKIGFATNEGTILRWEVEIGGLVEAGAPLVEIASEKAINVVVAPVTGTLLAIYAPPGAIIPEGETLGWLGSSTEQPPALQCRLLGWEDEIAPPPADLGQRLSAHLATHETGPEHAHQPAEKVDKLYKPFLKGQIRKITGQRMAKSWTDAPKVDLFAEVDFSRVVAHRQAEKETGVQPIPFNVYIVWAAGKAMQEFPELNCHWIDGRAVPVDGVHIGVAVALEESLLTISIKDIAGLEVREVERKYKGLIRKAVGMTLKREELYGSSLTVTNLGEFEVFNFTPILNPPEIFILGIGELEQRAVVKEGQVVAAPISYFCLSFDHRGVDGAPAARLLRSIKNHLENFGAEGE